MKKYPAILALEDGTLFRGRSFTGHVESEGEVVFNTSMSGYQEILTDPSYCGQMVTMTYPLIGNYGVNEEDIESRRIQVKALIVKEYQKYPSNWRSRKSLAEYLKSNNIPGVEGIDTRALTRHIRQAGAMKAALSTLDTDPDFLVEKARRSPDMIGRNLAGEVTCREPYLWKDGKPEYLRGGLEGFEWPDEPGKWRVVAMDFGVKYNILRSLENKGCSILVLPAHADSQTIERIAPHGLFLSNGPGDHPGSDRPKAYFRHLPGAPVGRVGLGGQDLQAQVRAPGGKPARQGSFHGKGGDYISEPWFLRGYGVSEKSRY